MTARFPQEQFSDILNKAAPRKGAAQIESACQTRNFDLPPFVYGTTVALYLGFMLVMAIGFQSRHMILPVAICIVYILMAFGVPTLWSRMKPVHTDKPMGWDRFLRSGMDCATGHLTASEALGQVLILPVLILGWGCAVALIASAIMG